MVVDCCIGDANTHMHGPYGQVDRVGDDVIARIFHDARVVELSGSDGAGDWHLAAPSEHAHSILGWIIGQGGSATPELTATSLLAEFGSLSSVVAASPARLSRATGDDVQAAVQIAAFGRAVRYVNRERIAARPLMGTRAALLTYLRGEIAFDAHEQFRVLFLDARNGLIREEIVGRGSVDEVPVYVREVIRRGLDLGAAAIIAAHNHPSGDPTPSATDIAVTHHLVCAAKLFAITVHDHIIIAPDAHVSMRDRGYL